MIGSSSSSGILRAVTVAAVVVGVTLAPSTSAAEIVFQVTVESAAGAGTYQVTDDQGEWSGDVFEWTLGADVGITSGEGVLLATLLAGQDDGTFVRLDTDPQVALGFAVQAAGDAETTSFTISAGIVDIDPPLENAVGRASAAFSVTDFILNDGATLIGLGTGGGAFLAQYNGFVPNGTTFCEEIDLITASAGGSATADATVPETGYLPLAGTVSDMSSQVHFSLTALDIASGTTNWEIVPEPATLALIILGVPILLRFRRR